MNLAQKIADILEVFATVLGALIYLLFFLPVSMLYLFIMRKQLNKKQWEWFKGNKDLEEFMDYIKERWK